MCRVWPAREVARRSALSPAASEISSSVEAWPKRGTTSALRRARGVEGCVGLLGSNRWSVWNGWVGGWVGGRAGVLMLQVVGRLKMQY